MREKYTVYYGRKKEVDIMTMTMIISVMGMVWDAFTVLLASNMHVVAIIMMFVIPLLVNSLLDDTTEES